MSLKVVHNFINYPREPRKIYVRPKESVPPPAATLCKICGKIIHKQKSRANKQGLCRRRCGKTEVTRKPKLKKKRPMPASEFYTSDKWRALRYQLIKNYKRQCMVCFRTNLELHVDHIKPRSKYPELELDINNLQVLCVDCNLGKGNKDEIDWRSK